MSTPENEIKLNGDVIPFKPKKTVTNTRKTTTIAAVVAVTVPHKTEISPEDKLSLWDTRCLLENKLSPESTLFLWEAHCLSRRHIISLEATLSLRRAHSLSRRHVVSSVFGVRSARARKNHVLLLIHK